MRTSNHSLILRIIALSGLLIGLTQIPRSLAQEARPALATKARSASAAQAEGRTIPALFISDIHFDPFHDPAKVQELISAPVKCACSGLRAMHCLSKANIASRSR
jgi:hypothetical protein